MNNFEVFLYFVCFAAIGSDERFDKDLFRKDEGDIVPAYREILDRLQPLAIQ